MSRSRRLTITQLVALLVIGALISAGVLFQITRMQLDNADERRAAELQRTDSLELADEVSMTSDALNQMASLYLTTGEERFRRYHDRIRDIRSGTDPRPADYDAGFWDRAVARGLDQVRLGEPASHVELAQEEGLTPPELEGLRDALHASNSLAALERRLMGDVTPLAEGEADAAYFAAAAAPLQRLTGDAYQEQKLEIEQLVDQLDSQIRDRTSTLLGAIEERGDELFVARIFILIVLAAVVGAALFITARAVVRPLRSLAGVTRRLTAGDYDERATPRGVEELARLGEDFNAMAGSVQRDIARRERAEHAAEEADRAKSEFLAVMSHELRTPMVGVAGTLDVLSRSELEPSQRELVEIAQRSARSLLEVIGEILDMSKIEAGGLRLSPVTVSLASVVEDAVTQYREAASEAGLVLSLAVDDEVAPAHVADPERLRQVLANLLSNAIKFTDEGGIEVRLDALGDAGESQRVQISVADTGPGISTADQEKLFVPFAQADASATRRAGGTGLGLVISREIATLMGGELTLDSSPGKGTTARLAIELPVGRTEELAAAPASLPAAAAPAPSPERAEREGSLLLLVEDHPTNRAVILRQLEAAGYRADTAADGVEALERLRERDYGLVLADVHMPNIDGYELARRIRATEAERGQGRMPIVAVTASALRGELDRAREAGADDVITKPTTIQVLAETIHRWLPGPVADGEPTLDELAGGDAEVRAQILDDYVATTRSDLESLAAALDSRDREEMRRQAHRIKGASHMVGASELAGTAGAFEAAALDADLEELRRIAGRMAAALDGFAPTASR